MSIPTPVQIRPPTGDLSDPVRAAHSRAVALPPSSHGTSRLLIIDLRGIGLSPSGLREWIVPIGQEVKGGMHGDAKLVVVCPVPAVLEVVSLYATEFDIPVYLARSMEEIPNARPAGGLTPSELETLERMHACGGVVTVSELADFIAIEPTAANNRLTSVERKGYVFRVGRPRSLGDLYVDPRTPAHALVGSLNVKAPRDALRAFGIETDPYDTTPLTLEGEAAKRAAEILRRRGKTH